jgi:uncharacterized protein (TIGR02001 family)
MLRPIAHSKRVLKQVLAWLIATSCAAHAGEATESAVTAPAYPKLTAGAVLMSDYIYRGISYSAHQPALGAYVDVQHGWLYAWTNFNSVEFSTSPAAELTMAAGIRPTLGPFEFDIGAAYYYYPGEIGPDLSNYWEAHATMSHKLTEKVTLGATLAYAPNVWQSGAWGTYAAGAISFELPSGLLPVPAEVGWSLSADLGRSVFGRTSGDGGGLTAGAAGLPLPAYTNWRAGLTFSYNVFKLGLNYTDTTLSKEHCFLMTGDLAALPGGVISADNPTGLRSALCGATFSATLGFEINPALRGR